MYGGAGGGLTWTLKDDNSRKCFLGFSEEGVASEGEQFRNGTDTLRDEGTDASWRLLRSWDSEDGLRDYPDQSERESDDRRLSPSAFEETGLSRSIQPRQAPATTSSAELSSASPWLQYALLNQPSLRGARAATWIKGYRAAAASAITLVLVDLLLIQSTRHTTEPDLYDGVVWGLTVPLNLW